MTAYGLSDLPDDFNNAWWIQKCKMIPLKLLIGSKIKWSWPLKWLETWRMWWMSHLNTSYRHLSRQSRTLILKLSWDSPFLSIRPGASPSPAAFPQPHQPGELCPDQPGGSCQTGNRGHVRGAVRHRRGDADRQRGLTLLFSHGLPVQLHRPHGGKRRLGKDGLHVVVPVYLTVGDTSDSFGGWFLLDRLVDGSVKLTG